MKWVWASFSLISVVLMGCWPSSSKLEGGNNASKEGTIVESTNELSTQTLEKCKNATVLIGNFQGGELISSGSGFAAGDGKTIYTNKHVVTGTDDTIDDCKLVFYAGTSRARVVNIKASQITTYDSAKRTDKDYYMHDVAQIRIEAMVADPLESNDLSDVRETQNAWALGFPNGLDIRKESSSLPSVTVHSLKIERIEKKAEKAMVLQFGGSPTYGNSGGPVVNLKGEVIGIIQAKGDSASPIIYGVPIWVARDIGNDQQARDEFLKPIAKDKKTEVASKPKERERIYSKGTSALAHKTLTISDLEGLSAVTLTILRNEPFARRGYRFQRRVLRNAFNESSWYSVRTSDLQAVENDFSSTERRNINFISEYQKANDLQW